MPTRPPPRPEARPRDASVRHKRLLKVRLPAWGTAIGDDAYTAIAAAAAEEDGVGVRRRVVLWLYHLPCTLPDPAPPLCTRSTPLSLALLSAIAIASAFPLTRTST